MNGLNDKYHRLHLYLPVVVLGGDLYVSHSNQRSIRLKKIPMARYVHFGIKNDRQTVACVVFVTQRHLQKFFKDTIQFSKQLEAQVLQNWSEEPAM
jgi:hypothetical protein